MFADYMFGFYRPICVLEVEMPVRHREKPTNKREEKQSHPLFVTVHRKPILLVPAHCVPARREKYRLLPRFPRSA
jgi:hypothetical protein